MPKVTGTYRNESWERLAVNLFDLDRIQEEIRSMLLAGNVDAAQLVKVNANRPGEIGVEFTCDLLRAACIVDTIRHHDRVSGDSITRVYVFKQSAWTRVSSETKLTRFIGDKLVLNPQVFSSEAVTVSSVEPEQQPVNFRRSKNAATD
jgi:hypothetical protein